MGVQDIITLFFSDSITVILTLFIVIAISYKICVRKELEHKLPPCFPRVPILGSFPWLKMGKRGLYEVTLELARKHHARISMCYLGNRRTVVLHDYEAIREAYVKHADIFSGKAEFSVFVGELSGHGVIQNNGPSWKQHRKFALHSLRDFGVGKQSLEDKIGEELLVLTDEFLNAGVDKSLGEEEGAAAVPFDPSHYISNAVSNIICNIVFGQRYKYSDEEFKRLLHMMDSLFKNSRFGLILETVPITWLFRKFLKFDENKASFDSILAFIEEHINEHKRTYDGQVVRHFIDAYLKEMYQQQQEGEEGGGLAATEFNDKHLKKLIFDLFLAGSETTNTTLKWGLLFMCLHPHVQGKVQEEIDHIVATRGRLPSCSQDRAHMPYTEACIMEIQRVANIAPLALMHLTSAPSVIAGYQIPRGTYVLPNLWACHKDPNYWPEPERFDPNRFIDSDGKVMSKPDSFMPFSTGRRVCLGEPLAKMELFLFFTSLMHGFTISLPPPPHPQRDVADLLRPVLGLTLSPQPYRIIAQPRRTAPHD